MLGRLGRGLRESREPLLIFVATRGVNDHQIGQVIELFLSGSHFLSLNFQPVARSGVSL